jgi:hypothetical protein
MRCAATYMLLGGDFSDWELYPPECKPEEIDPCDQSYEGNAPGLTVMTRALAGTDGYAFTPLPVASHVLLATNWTNTDWKAHVWERLAGNPTIYKGTLRPSSPSITVTSTNDNLWMVCYETTGESSTDVTWT